VGIQNVSDFKTRSSQKYTTALGTPLPVSHHLKKETKPSGPRSAATSLRGMIKRSLLGGASRGSEGKPPLPIQRGGVSLPHLAHRRGSFIARRTRATTELGTKEKNLGKPSHHGRASDKG